MDNHKVSVAYKPLKSNLVNLPSALSNLLFNANVSIQDVLIEIVGEKGSKVYCGWSGMSSSSVKVLEIDSLSAQCLNLSNNQQVTVNLKLNNFETTQINLEPVTSSDWELVELHAQTLEDKLLSQCRCVALNQVLVVFPSNTTSAKLIVTDIGTKEHSFAKISPICEVAVAPKVREKKASFASSKNSKGTAPRAEDSSKYPTVLKRGISLPHQLYEHLPSASNTEGYEVYADVRELSPSFGVSGFVSVSVLSGPNSKINTVGSGTSDLTDESNDSQKVSESREKSSIGFKENKKIIAKLIDFHNGPKNNVGLSSSLAVALNVEFRVGEIVALKPASKHVSKKPSTLIVHPYITQTKKLNQVNLNSSEKKEKEKRFCQNLAAVLFNKESSISRSPISNYTKIPIIPTILPNGGLLRFKRNDDSLAWINPKSISEDSKPFKIELGEELLRNATFIQTADTKETSLEKAVGLDKDIDDMISSFTISRNTGVLIHGNSGSGKSLLAKIVAQRVNNEFGFHTKYVNCDSIMNENYSQLTGNHFNDWLQECAWNKPSVLILDNADKIFSAEVEHVDTTQSNQLTEFLLSRLQKLHSQRNSNLSIIFTGVAKEAFNKLLFQSHLIEHYTHLQPPDKSLRADLISEYLENHLSCGIDFDIMDIVSETEGYLPNDLKVLSERIYHEALFNSSIDSSEDQLSVSRKNFESALKGYTPSNLRGVKLEKSTIGWSDIGGLKNAKQVLLETLEWPTKYAPIFANCPLRLRSGILLYGYPGCGKTLLASAVAGQCGLNFISIKGPEILNKYIGASEQSVRELFERAQSAKPCILFFDEFDSIAPKRGHDSTGVTDRVVNQMLTQMDGAEGLDGVYVLAATSRPDLIDSALLRPGRLDKSIICDMPNYEDRLDILKSITLKMDLSSDVDLTTISKLTVGFSGADMQGLGYNAYLKAVHRKLESKEAQVMKTETSDAKDQTAIEFFQVNAEKLKSTKLRPADRLKILQQIEQLFADDDSESRELGINNVSVQSSESSKVFINQQDFVESMKETKPSISATEKKKLQRIYKEFVSERDGNMPDGTPSNEVGGRSTLM